MPPAKDNTNETPTNEALPGDGPAKPAQVLDDVVDPLAPMEFVLHRKEVPVKLTHPTTGVVTDYVLREVDGDGRDAYLNNLGGRMRHTKDGSPAGVRDFKGLQANLVARCLFKKEDDKQATEAEVQAFPAGMQSALFERAKLISGLNDDAETEAGND